MAASWCSGSWNRTVTELVPVTSTATKNGMSGGPENNTYLYSICAVCYILLLGKQFLMLERIWCLHLQCIFLNCFKMKHYSAKKSKNSAASWTALRWSTTVPSNPRTMLFLELLQDKALQCQAIQEHCHFLNCFEMKHYSAKQSKDSASYWIALRWSNTVLQSRRKYSPIDT